MEKEILVRFLGKTIVFHKTGSSYLLFGRLEKVTDTSIVLEFKGRTQLHSLDSLEDVRESNKIPRGGY